MSEGQAMMLWLMFIIGLFSIPVLCRKHQWREKVSLGLWQYQYEYAYSKKLRIAAAIWLVFWCLPPLATIWIAGVFG